MSEPSNPYQAPSALFRNGLPVPLEQLYPAQEGRRFITHVIDYVCIALLCAGFLFGQNLLELEPMNAAVDGLTGV